MGNKYSGIYCRPAPLIYPMRNEILPFTQQDGLAKNYFFAPAQLNVVNSSY